MSKNETYNETPIEKTPGYLGYIFDDFLTFSSGLKPLDGFDFSLYGIMADELGQLDRKLEIHFGDGSPRAEFEAYSVSQIVQSIPLVTAIYDCPPDQGPAGGSGYVFVLQQGGSREECKRQAQILRIALNEDFEKLRKEYETLINRSAQ